MKIIELSIENIKKIKAAHIVPADNTILIQGDNAAGKSSILDSIVWALVGGKSIDSLPIRNGEKKGSIKAVLGEGPDKIEYEITRSFTEKGNYLKIETLDGSKIGSPQAFLDKLVGSISFDPLAFINQDEKKQRKVLMELIGIDVDALDKKEKEVFDERTIKGRELKVQETKVKGLKKWDDVKEIEEVKVSELVKKLEEANKHNKELEDRIEKNTRLKTKASDWISHIELLRTQMVSLEKEIAEYEDSIEKAREQFKAEKQAISELEPIDTESIKTSIQEVENTNAKIRDNKAYKSEQKSLEIVKSQYDVIDKELETIRAAKIQTLESAPIPVPNLTFSDSGLIYNSIPLAQCSDGEKLMVSMGISMALNPTMRVLRIKDGSLLGPTNMKILSAMVKEKDFQIFIEKVNDLDGYNNSGKVGIFIEDGGVVAVDGMAVNDVKTVTKNNVATINDTKTEKDVDDDW